MDSENLGESIQVARLNAGLTQQQLCEQTGLSYSTLAKIERGAIKSPSIFTINLICQGLGISIEKLLITGVKAESNKPKNGLSKVKESLENTKIKFIYSDINGVLVRFYQRAFASLARDTNQSLDLVEQVFWRYNDAVCMGEMSELELNKILAESLEVDEVDWKNYYVSAVEPIKPSHEYLRKLSESYRIGLFSNIFPGYLDALIEAGKVPNLDYSIIIDSSQVHSIKPSREIYEIAENKAGVRGGEILFIDDTRSNIATAQQMGWRGIWFDSYHPEESIKDINQILTADR